MTRILTIVSSALAVVAFAAAIAVPWLWDDAVKLGRGQNFARVALERRVHRESPDRPIIAWIGDSTLLHAKGIRPYPYRIAKSIGKTPPVQTVMLADLGIDSYLGYCLVAKLMTIDPEVVVIIANLRVLGTRTPRPGTLSLASFIPSDEMLNATFLPWHHRQITIPRLWLAQTLNWSPVEEGFFFYEGLRLTVRDQMYRSRLKHSLIDAVVQMKGLYSNYVRPLDQPVVEMLQAEVETVVRHGRRAIVVVTPIPVELLREKGLYSAAVQDRIAMLRVVVNDAGEGCSTSTTRCRKPSSQTKAATSTTPGRREWRSWSEPSCGRSCTWP